MPAHINKAFKLRGSDPVSLKKAKNFFEHDKIWNCEKIRSDLEQHRAANPGPKKPSYSSSPDFFIGDTLKVMHDAGFVKILDETTWSISYDPQPERYFMWAHPSGLLFSARTYRYNPNHDEEFQTITSGELVSVINIGFSRMGYHGSLGLSSASSSGHMGMTGEAYTSRSNSVSSPYEIVSELESIQKAGRIVPFHQQNLAEVSLHSSGIEKIPLNQWENGFSDLSVPKTRAEMDEHFEQYGQIYARKVWQRCSENVPVLNNIIPQLGTVLAVSMYHHGYSYASSRNEASDLFNDALSKTASEFGIYENPSKRQINEGMWMGPHVDKNTIINFYNVEGAAHFVGHIQDHEQQRYLSSSDAKMVQDWLQGIKNHHQEVKWGSLNTTQTTSAGIGLVHLCIAQDACEYWDETSPQSLGLKAIEFTSEKLLHTACTQPLADGSTLPLMIVQEYLRMLGEYSFRQRVLSHAFGDILKALDKKVPAHLWVCGEGDSNTLDGLWLQQLYALRSSSIVSKKQWDEICAPLLELGVVPPSHCALRLPLRSKPTEEHSYRLDYLAAEHINRPSIEEAFEELIKDMPQSWKEKRLKLVLENVLVERENPIAKRKM